MEFFIMRYLFIRLFVLTLLFLNSPAQSQWKGTKEVKDGVIHIYNTRKGLWKDKKKMVMEEIVTIGIEDGDDNYILNNPTSIAIDDNNSIYICDMNDYSIKVYDQNGRFLRMIGKKGQGPGEFQGPKRIAITNDQKLCVIDIARKIHYLTLQGDYIKSYLTKYVLDYMTVIPGNDSILLSRLVFPWEKVIEPWNFAEFNDNGEITRKMGELVSYGETDGQAMGLAVWYSETKLSGSCDGKLLVAYDYPYRIDIYDSDFNKTMFITRENKNFTEVVPYKRRGVDYLALRSKINFCSWLETGNTYFLIGFKDLGPDFVEKMKNRDYSPMRILYDLYDADGHFL